MIRIVLADDHAVLRAGLRALLDREPDVSVIGEAGDGATAIELVVSLKPDVLLLDVTMPGNEDLGVLRALREREPATHILILTMHEEEALLRAALELGAAGYVLKRAAEDDLLTAIRAVARGESFVDPRMTRMLIDRVVGPTGAGAPARALDEVTPRELEVLKLVAAGYSNKEISARLCISVRTVETHKAHINEKLDLRSRVELVRYARQRGLLDPL
jgi:DNA-binding NarL/FixJ family response regulator